MFELSHTEDELTSNDLISEGLTGLMKFVWLASLPRIVPQIIRVFCGTIVQNMQNVAICLKNIKSPAKNALFLRET